MIGGVAEHAGGDVWAMGDTANERCPCGEKRLFGDMELFGEMVFDGDTSF